MRDGSSFPVLRWLALGVWVVCGAAASADFFVGPRGNDTNAGTAQAPFATFERARTAVRQLKSEGRIAEGGLTVWLLAGDHVRTATFELGRDDSGTDSAPIQWRAQAGAEVRILGGRPLSFVPLTDPEVMRRLDPSAKSEVKVADVSGWGMEPSDGLVSRGFGRATTPAHHELFHGRRPMTLARWPNEGTFETIAGFPEVSGQGDDHGGKIGSLEHGFHYAGDRPRRWQTANGVWVHGYWSWDWANSYERVVSLDPDTRLIRTAAPHGLYGFRKGQRFYFLNILEELDHPGEWFFDASAMKVYFWPPPSGGPAGASSETLLSVLNGPLLRLNEASHLTFQGMTWEATRGNGIEIRGGTHNRIVGCVLQNLGNHGVDVSGGTDHAVVGCDVRDTGDGGVNLTGGDRATLTPGGHRVENCLFERQGRWSKCYVPAIHLQGVGMRASQNLIRDHPHCGILYWGNDHQIELNEIHHVALETGDVGAIYTGRDYTFRGNRIRHNYVHHIGGVGMGSMGAYMDDCVSGTEISGNIFFKVQRAAFLGGGRDHHVTNNVFVDCHHAVELDGRGLDRSPVWRSMVDKTMRDRLGDIPLALYRSRYPAMKSLDAHYGPPGGPPLAGDAFRGVPPENNVVSRNICVGKWLRVGWNATQDMLHLEANLTQEDPRFVGPVVDGAPATAFALKDDSPAWSLGFERIPVDRIGWQRHGPGRSQEGSR